MNGIERLEEIKSRVWKEKGTYAMGDYSQREGCIYTLSDYDYEWLIEQAERKQNLEERLKRQIERNWDKERLSELLPDTIYYIDKLKEEIKNLERRLEEQIESNRMYMWKNKRYREALEQIKREETVTTGLSKGQVAYTASGLIAHQALEGEE